MPSQLIDALIAQGARDLTIVNNNAGNGDIGLAALLKARRVRKIVCSFPRQADSHVFDALYRAGEIELELVPQGNLADASVRPARASAASSRRPDTARARRRQGDAPVRRPADGARAPIHADYALDQGARGDRWGNMVYRKTARNFGPAMAMAARCTVVQVDESSRSVTSIRRPSSRPASSCTASCGSRRSPARRCRRRHDRRHRRPRRVGAHAGPRRLRIDR